MVILLILLLLFVGITANIVDGITDIIVNKRVDVLIKFILWGLVFLFIYNSL